jgi:uncharacterized protein
MYIMPDQKLLVPNVASGKVGPTPVKFDWNQHNQYKNLIKHQVNNHECEQIFFNEPIIINSDDKHSKKEKRFRSLGKTNKNRKLFLSFTIRNKKIRVISAKDQNKKERLIYAQEKSA